MCDNGRLPRSSSSFKMSSAAIGTGRGAATAAAAAAKATKNERACNRVRKLLQNNYQPFF